MFDSKLVIPLIGIDGKPDLVLFAENDADSLLHREDAVDHGESPWQIREGCNYEYWISKGFMLANSELVSKSKVNPSAGRISPSIYVGTLSIDVLNNNGEKCGMVDLEVQSVKASYREDYRLMLEEITEKCTDLLLLHSSPVSQNLLVDQHSDNTTLYQRFAFIKSIIDSEEFTDSLHKILSSPVTRWRELEEVKDIRNVRRFSGSALRQLAGAGNRIGLPESHSLRKMLPNIPARICVYNKTETVDTQENRFIKHAIISFQSLFNEIIGRVNASTRIYTEASKLSDKLEQFLNHSVFKDIGILSTLPLNSPVLQRKEGYREILRIWLMFDLAAKMVWHGGDDVYKGNKRDVAVLYEYWLFFKLVELVTDVFRLKSPSTENLIEETKDGLGLKLKQGKFLPVEGIYESETRKLRVDFSYNKTFNGENQYPTGGSWSSSLRPDYTLSVWPFGIEQDQAEKEELIVHIHFDAKYKVESLKSIFGEDDKLDLEKEEQKKGTFKRADILKMHTYRDAIRRTSGAYVLYPGTESHHKRGFHEILPGLGAFAIRPSRIDNGISELKIFLGEILTHFQNRASQRERISLKTYDTYKNKETNFVNESLPEPFGFKRNLIPDETFVLVGYYRKENWDWIIKTGLYNARAGSERGSLRLGPREAGAKYLLLHTSNETVTNRFLKITETGPRIFSKRTLVENGYPDPTQEYYLVYKVETISEAEFLGKFWDIRKLKGYRAKRESALPFSVTMSELMKVKID